MIIYVFYDASAPHGQRAYPSIKKARSARAEHFPRSERPEILKIDIGALTLGKACAMLTGKNYATSIEEVPEWHEKSPDA